MRHAWVRWLLRCGFTAVLLLGLAACAVAPRAASNAQANLWSGRLSLQVQSEPVQSFSAAFILEGNSGQGKLTVTSPFGNTLAVAAWEPGKATLTSGGEIQVFASASQLLERATGAAIPLGGLFDWLAGKATPVNGWTADLTRFTEGRILAKRVQPLPESDLRIVLDQ
ncbi:MAG: lipoprotein insertase outer membrane protein LolB [Pseudomonadota bacterium]